MVMDTKQLSEKLVDSLFHKIYEKKGFDFNQRELITTVVNSSMEFVLLKIVQDSKNDVEVKERISKIEKYVTAWIAVYIHQLENYSNADTEGPFREFLESIVSEKEYASEDYNNSGHPLKKQ